MNAYICETYYHLLIALIKNIKKRGKNDLLIFSDKKSNTIVKDEILLTNLKKSNIFNNIFIYDYVSQFDNSNSEIIYEIKRYFFIKKLGNKLIDLLNAYDEIYLFNDISSIGKCINKIKCNYNLIEDGLNCFKENRNIIKNKSILKIFIKKVLYGSYELGKSELIKSIEVNDRDKVTLSNKNIIEYPRDVLFKTLNKYEKNELLNIFSLPQNIDFKENYSLLITQPFFEDSLLESEYAQIELYNKIISDYMENEKVIIKLHPRENTHYDDYIDNIIILDKNFPIEILNFNDSIRFKKVITISSTSIDMMKNIDIKIKLGWNWFYHYKEENK